MMHKWRSGAPSALRVKSSSSMPALRKAETASDDFTMKTGEMSASIEWMLLVMVGMVSANLGDIPAGAS